MTLGLVALAAAVAAPASAAPPQQAASLGAASARLEGGVLTLSTGAMTRTFDWNGGHLIARRLDGAEGASIVSDGVEPDLVVPGVDLAAAGSATLEIAERRGDPIGPDHLEVRVERTATHAGGALAIRRTCRLVPQSPAIGCTVALKGVAPEGFSAGDTRSVGMIETDRGGARTGGFRVDRIGPPGRHWRARAVSFVTATDHNDTLVHERTSLLFREPQRLTGNLLLLAPEGAARGGPQLFLLKESPPGADQIGFPGADWRARVGSVEATGSGFTAADLSPDRWTEAYAVVVGVTGPGRLAILDAVRGHMETVRPFKADRDLVATSNSWGDRSRDGRMSEAFMLREIEAAADLGLSHVQLDDGWQAGLSKNSANRAGRRWEDWRTEDWAPHPERFPRGLGPVVEAARARGLGVGAWFNPSQANDYALWSRDADIVIDLHRRHGIAQVKIDGIEVGSVRARENLRAFFERVTSETDGAVVFNVDVTAGRRPGYFALNRYGNIFLENRYTDWANHYPHRTLRNLWMLAHWIPPQWFQVEFLNVARNADRYEPGDPLAPAAVGFEAAFAITMAAQPLAWMEVSNLPAEARATPLIRRFREIQPRLHAGRILPIGAEPDGASWTGFQSRDPGDRTGRLIVHREPLAPDVGRVATFLPPGSRVRLTPEMGDGRAMRARVDAEGGQNLHLPKAGRFAVWRYAIE